MEHKIDLIILPFHDYKKWKKEGFRTRDAHLFEHFQNDERVEKILVINRPVSLAEMIIKRMNWKTNLGNKVISGKDWQLNQISEKVYYIDFFVLDLIKVAIEGKEWWNTIFNNQKIVENINQAIEFIGMSNKVLFLENPMSVGLVNKLGENKFVFDAIDNWLYHPQMKNSKSIIENNYKFISKNADLIYTVSESLREFFRCQNDNVYWIPNGVDANRFKPAIIRQNEKREVPIIGYIGKIQDRVDFDLIEKCLNKYKNNKFIIIGPVYSQKEKIKKIKRNYKNIEFLGDIHYDKLPYEMKKIDIAIIPHKVDSFTNSMNPLKIYEYLAAGKQIITTKIAGANGFSEYVYQANSDDEFIEKIQKAMDNYKKIDNISECVIEQLKKENLWEYKANQILDKMCLNNDD